jgi:2-oxoglutarate/2-oxoacid ferredoxin oxidoreductase subunit alpha
MSQVNDFAFKIATANGTGSASANGLIMQAIFRMGVPVTGKNVFPSNIQGLPTWYEIRVSKDGYTARTPVFDLMVALNPATYAKDVAEVRPGGWLLYDSTWPLDEALTRADVTYLGVPLAEMCNAAFKGVRERILMKNIAYAGALAALIGLDPEVIRALTKEKYSKKPALLDSNDRAIALGYDYATKAFQCPLPIQLEKMDATKDSILIDGNTAAGLGAVFAGATVGAWYPITPSTSLMEAFKGFCQKYRRDEASKKNRFAILQAEDELAAIGMVIGASWAGARAFTPTSGPGISLMGEFVGLAYYAEVPAVLFDVQRAGPSTGMPTRTQQCDLLLCAYASHGDTRHICLYPSDPREAFELAVKAFDLAERFQTPVFVLSDLDIGMNDWMVPRLTWDDIPGRRWRRHPVPIAAGRPSERRVLHAWVRAQQVRRLHGGRGRIPGGRGPDRAEDSECRPGRARAVRPQGHRPDQARPAHRRRLPCRVHGSHRPDGEGRHWARLHARARVPVQRRGPRVRPPARRDVRGGAEPRRPVAIAAATRERCVGRQA